MSDGPDEPGIRVEIQVNPPEARSHIMLHWSLVFLVIALIAGVLGFTGVYVAAAGIAKILFFVFLVLFVISLLTSRRSLPV